jgi:lipopolysaccharide biosynthesis protein
LLLEDGAFDSFDVVCKIHGKKSIGNERIAIFGDIMRRAIFLDLIATNAQALKIVQMFHDDPQIGLVGPRRLRLAPNSKALRSLLGRNRRAAESIAARMGSAIRKDTFDFFEGTMFWARPQALAPLRRLRLAEESFAPEAGLGDGALEHAMERLFNHTARVAGFRIADVAVDGEPPDDARAGETTLKPADAREMLAHRN